MSFDFDRFTKEIEEALQHHCHAYAFVVSHKLEPVRKKAGGKARTIRNIPDLKMSTNVPFHVASVSKAISAAALLRLLAQNKKLTVDDTFHHLLPRHWKVHDSIVPLTFRQLLTHTSGFGNVKHDYHSIKERIRKGVPNPDSKNVYKYKYVGINFDLMRFLIPALAGYNIIQDKSPGTSFEIIQAASYAGLYIDYVNRLFKKAGLSKLGCKAFPFVGGVCYHFPDHDKAGTDFGDSSLTCGAKGWVMSAAQMAKFFRVLHLTDNILPAGVSKKMRVELLGYDACGKTADNVQYYWKNGGFPDKGNAGAVETLTIGFSNDVSVALIINSRFDSTVGKEQMIIDAHGKAYKLTLKRKPH